LGPPLSQKDAGGREAWDKARIQSPDVSYWSARAPRGVSSPTGRLRLYAAR
jgi:hypothetical protein